MNPRDNAHLTIIETLKALGCKSDDKGVCHGIACTGLGAILMGKEKGLDPFNKRIDFMLETAVEALKRTDGERYSKKHQEWENFIQEIGGIENVSYEQWKPWEKAFRVAQYADFYEIEFKEWRDEVDEADKLTLTEMVEIKKNQNENIHPDEIEAFKEKAKNARGFTRLFLLFTDNDRREWDLLKSVEGLCRA